MPRRQKTVEVGQPAKRRWHQRRVMPTDTQMLNWIGRNVTSIETLKGKGHRVQIEACYPTAEPELTTASGKSVVDAFRKAVIKAGWK